MPTATFPEIFNGLLFRLILWMCLQNLKSVALPVPEIIGGNQKIGQAVDTPTLPFLQNFEWAFVRMDTVNVPAEFEVRRFTCAWDNSDWSIGGCEAITLGRGGRRGSALVPFEFSSKERCSTVTFPLSLRVSDILLLLCSSTPLFPTPPLVSPKCPHVPMGVGGWPLGFQERRCWASCLCN